MASEIVAGRDEATFPSWFSKTACKAKEYGAKGDLVTDDTAALQKMLDAPECKLATLDKGYYAVSKTLQMVSTPRFLPTSRQPSRQPSRATDATSFCAV